jgi:hypothetical protein
VLKAVMALPLTPLTTNVFIYPRPAELGVILAYELSFRRGVRNWLEVARWVASRDHVWSTEEEEAFGEIGFDLQDGRFTEEQIQIMSQPMGMDEFFEITNRIQNAMEEPNDTSLDKG